MVAGSANSPLFVYEEAGVPRTVTATGTLSTAALQSNALNASGSALLALRDRRYPLCAFMHSTIRIVLLPCIVYCTLFTLHSMLVYAHSHAHTVAL